MKIFDSFLIFKELDMLELRLRLLWPYVDHFVIGEGKYTQSGKEKPMYFGDNMDRFKWAKSKIVHFVHDFRPDNEGDAERLPREMMAKVALDMRSSDNDILMMSDIDEIPSREVLSRINELELPIALNSDCYYYNIKCSRQRKWPSTVIMKLNGTPNKLWKNMAAKSTIPNINAGWHFSYFMTNAEIRDKLAAFTHHASYNKLPYTENIYLDKHRSEGTNFLGKTSFGKEPPEELPQYLLEELKNFPLFTGES